MIGSAVQELLIGFLTEIVNVIPADDTKPKAGSTGSSNKGSVPSVDFIVSAVTAAQEGAAGSAQARADLNANNKKLAKAYQDLASISSLDAVAKVIQSQNDFFASEMALTPDEIFAIASDWGRSPIIPPGTGISLGFDEYARAIIASTNSSESSELVSLLEYAIPTWKLFEGQLNSCVQLLLSSSLYSKEVV